MRLVIGLVVAAALGLQLFECFVHGHCETHTLAGDPPPD